MTVVLVMVAVLLLALVAYAVRNQTRPAGGRGKVWRRRLMPKGVQPMYARLREHGAGQPRK